MKVFKGNFVVKCAVCISAIFIFVYVLFLSLPLFVSPFIGKYNNEIENIIKQNTALDAKIEGLGVSTTPNLHVGIKLKNIVVSAQNDPILEAKNSSVSLKLLPLIFKKIELAQIKTNNLEVSLSVKKDGTFVIEDYFPQNNQTTQPPVTLPFDLKLSNTLPNLIVKNYKVSISEEGKLYSITGEDFGITDFVLDKKVKVRAKGNIVFDNWLVSKYDVKIANRIMPNLVFDDLVFPKEVVSEQVASKKTDSKVSSADINVLKILKAIKNNKFRGDVYADIRTSGTFKSPKQYGEISINNLSVGVNGISLPSSNIKLLFKGDKSEIDSTLYSSQDKNEVTSLNGFYAKRMIDLNLKSNAKFNNLIRLADAIASSFNINDLRTITATGGIDADLSFKSDFKTVNSSGYLKINPSSFRYGQYNLSADNIIADVNLDNNNVYIKNLGLLLMGHPLNLVGKISDEAVANLTLTGNNLSLKGLLATAGQISILKDNVINSGNLSVSAKLVGPLKKIKPDISLVANNFNIYNKPGKIRLMLDNSLVKFIISGNQVSGDVDVTKLGLNMEGASVSVPKASVKIDSKDVHIKDSYVLINKSRIDVKGYIKEYLSDKFDMKFTAQGNLASADVAAFIPKELRVFFPYKGVLPVSVKVTGDKKVQDVCFNLSATPGNYFQFADVNLLKNKKTKIHTDVKISGNSAKLVNSGIYADDKQIASFDGTISNFAQPRLNINAFVPQDVSFPVWGLKNSNITANGKIIIGGTLDNLKLGGKVNISDLSVKDMDFALSDLTANLNGAGISGNATAQKFKYGGIIATNLASKFSLLNFTNFYLENLTADAFGGKAHGKISYNIPSFTIGLDLSGKGLNSMDAVYGAVGIPRALTGTLDFSAKIIASGVTDKEIIKSMKGNVDFNINDGRFVSIGKLENIVAAQNIASNSLLKSALSAMTTVSAIQKTDKFDTITGKLSLSSGNANISNIRVVGPLMSYYVTGVYYILPNSANLRILGRLDSKIVSYLGPLGQLSVEKVLAYIPGLGDKTIKMITSFTSDPSKENIQLIPQLSTGSKEYKDFRVIYNGPIEKTSSVKSFMWLSKCDTTQLNLKKDLQDAKKAVEDNIKNQIKSTKTSIDNTQKNIEKAVDYQKQKIENEKKVLEQTKTDIVNIKQNAGQKATNLSKLLLNAASNSNKKVDTPAKNSNGTELKDSDSTTTTTQSEEKEPVKSE